MFHPHLGPSLTTKLCFLPCLSSPASPHILDSETFTCTSLTDCSFILVLGRGIIFNICPRTRTQSRTLVKEVLFATFCFIVAILFVFFPPPTASLPHTHATYLQQWQSYGVATLLVCIFPPLTFSFC